MKSLKNIQDLKLGQISNQKAELGCAIVFTGNKQAYAP
jgi:hypothetical protein